MRHKMLPVLDALCLNCCTCSRRDGTIAVIGRSSNDRPRGKFQECFNSMTRGYTMPVFTFEKISPARRGPIAPVDKKERGWFAQIVARFVEARVKRALRAEQSVIAREPKSPAPK